MHIYVWIMDCFICTYANSSDVTTLPQEHRRRRSEKKRKKKTVILDMQKNWNIPLIRPVAQTKSLQQNTLNLVDKQHYRPLDIRDSETASRSLPIWCF